MSKTQSRSINSITKEKDVFVLDDTDKESDDENIFFHKGNITINNFDPIN